MKYLETAKKIVKKSKYGSFFFSFFPKSFLYTKNYNKIVELHNLLDNGNEEIVDLHLRKRMVIVLQEALQNVPWYRKNVLIDSHNINETNVYEILNQFPFTDKKIIMDNWDDFLNEKYSKKNLKIGSTEGTTGQGILIANNRKEIGVQMASFEVASKNIHFDFIKTRTIRLGLEALKNINEYPCEIYGNRLLVSPVHLTPKWFDTIYRDCINFNTTAIHSYPTLLFLFAQYINENNLPPINVKLLQLSSDVFLWQHYIAFNKAFNYPEILCSYNMSEHVALGFSVINNEHKSIGYQLDKIYAFNENLRDEFDRFEIIGTSYWNEAMPFIRYKTQDFGEIDENNFIKSIDGRGQTFLTTKEGNKIAGISMLSPDDYIWNYILAFQFVQREVGKIIIRLVVKSTYSDDIEKKILFDMEQKWPNLFDYTIEIVDEIQKGRSTKVQSIIVDFQV